MSLVNNLFSILSSCLHCFSLLWCYIIFLTHPFFFCLPAWGDFFMSCLPFFDCFLAAAWWAVLHLLYYSYFDAAKLQCRSRTSLYLKWRKEKESEKLFQYQGKKWRKGGWTDFLHIKFFFILSSAAACRYWITHGTKKEDSGLTNFFPVVITLFFFIRVAKNCDRGSIFFMHVPKSLSKVSLFTLWQLPSVECP